VIRFVFRWLFRLVVLAIVLVVALLLLEDTLARSFAEREIRRATGFDAKVGKVQLGLLEPRIWVENLVLYNPPEFGGSPLIDAPDIQLDYAPAELVRNKVHLRFLRLNIRELNIVENNGRTNILELLHKPAAPGSGSTSGAASQKYAFAGIDLLNLSIGKLRYSDLKRPRRNQEVNLALENHIMRNVHSEDELVAFLLNQLFRAGITIYMDDVPSRKRTR
jgi:uncharacterized protein involved in outer membrane biogenesis